MNNINILLFLSCLIFYKYSDTKNKYIKNGVGVLSIYFLYKIISNGKRIKEGLIIQLPGAGIFASPNLSPDGMEGKCIVDQIEEENLELGSGQDPSPNPYYAMMQREGLYLNSDSKCKQIRDGRKYLEDGESCEFQCSNSTDGKSRVLKRRGDGEDAPTRHFVKCQVNDGQAKIIIDDSVKCITPPAPPPADVVNPTADEKDAVNRINNQVCKNTTIGDSDLKYDSRPGKDTDVLCDPDKDSNIDVNKIKKCCIPDGDAYVSWRDGNVYMLLYACMLIRTFFLGIFLLYFVASIFMTSQFGKIDFAGGTTLTFPGNKFKDPNPLSIGRDKGPQVLGYHPLTPSTASKGAWFYENLQRGFMLLLVIGVTIGIEAACIYIFGEKTARFGLEDSNDKGGLWDQWKLFGFYRGDGAFNFGNADREKVIPNTGVKGMHKGRDSGDSYSLQDNTTS